MSPPYINPESDEYTEKIEAQIAILIAQITTSSMFQGIAETKEPADRTTAAIPLAFACLEVLVGLAQGTGTEHSWDEFLREALNECIARAAIKYEQQA